MRLQHPSLLAVVILLVVASAVSAQTQTGEIFGRVTDASSAVLPGVTVTATSPALLQPLVAVAEGTGTYQFARLPIGTYSVRFELVGFKTLVKEGIRIQIGFHAQVNAQLEISTVEETVTVSGATPVVDLQNTGTGATFNLETLQNIPSARDPWVMLEQTPGIAMDRQNVGGTASGQQSGYVSRGASTSNNVWNVDGVNVTDMSSRSTPFYYDFDSFEEMQISTGGNDASIQTGGVAINIVTKSGTNQFRGSVRYFIVDDGLQSDNVDDTLRAQGARSGAPVKSIKDWGAEVSGPVVKDRAWIWSAYGRQDVRVGILGFYVPGTQELATDLSVLKNFNIKGQAQAFKGNKMTWHSNLADKIRNARDASDLRPLETTLKQAGPVWTHRLSDQHIFTHRFMTEVTAAWIGNTWWTDFQDPSLATVQRSLELVSPANLWGRSYSSARYVRPSTSLDLVANYFLPGVLGGDHSLKSGFRYRNAPATTTTHVGGNTTARFRNNVAVEAELHRDSVTAYGLTVVSAYLQDTYKRGRLTANLGFRVDRQNDEARGSSISGHPFLPAFLPAVTFAGADSDVVWTDFSPRAGVTFDLRGNGKTVAKGSFARYYGQMGPGTIASILNPVNAASVRFPWVDLNGDRFVQANELDTTRILAFSGNYDPTNPGFIGTKNTVDSKLANDTTDEVILGLDHELAANFGLGVSYVWRRYGALLWDDTVGLASADYLPVTYTATGCPGGCPSVVYYQPAFPTPSLRQRTNVPDRSRGYQGFEVTARKRFADRWAMSGSLGYNDAREYYDSANAYEDPTTIPFLHNAQYAPEASGSGRTDVFINARWLVKLTGMYSLPWDINVAAFYNSHQGYPLPEAILSPSRLNQAGTVMVPLKLMGETRLDRVQLVDARVEKVFRLFGRARVSASFDVFNLTNANTALIKERQLNSTRATLIRDIVPPRVARLGMRVTW